VPHLVALIIDEIVRAKTLLTRLPLPRDVRVARVTDAIIHAPSDPRSLEQWAETSGASGRTLARLFHSETGLSFGQWRLQARLNAAFIMLMMGEDIPRVAVAVGFSGQSAFGAAFRRTFGLTPGQARVLHTSENEGQTSLSV
jgi:AraC-like DNA-binding protein